MTEKKFSMDEVINCIKECINEILQDDFFINFVRNSLYLNDIESCNMSATDVDDLFIYLLIKKLNISISNLEGVPELEDIFKICLKDEYTETEFENILNSLNDIFYKVSDKFYSDIGKIFETDNKNILEELIDKNIDIGDICRDYYFYYTDISRHTDQSINGFVKYCNIDLLKKSIDLEMYNIIPYVSDEVFEQLSKEYIDKLMNYIMKDFIRFNQERKIKYILKNINLIELLQCNQNSDEAKILFSFVDSMDEDTFNRIVDNYLYSGIETCKPVTKNEAYVKKLLEKSYSSIIWGLEEHQFNGELLQLMKEKGAFSSAVQDSGFSYDILRSDYVFNIFVEQLSDDFFYRGLLRKIPKDSLTDIRILTCILNCNFSFFYLSPDEKKIKKYENRTLDDIRYAIEHGYKCSSKTHLKNLEEVRVFIENGYPEIINYISSSINVNFDTIKYAVEHGYKFDSNSTLNNFPFNTLSFCLENNMYDAIIPYFLKDSYITKKTIQTYIDNNPSYSKDGSFETFFREIGILDEFIDNLITMENKDLTFNDENWIECARERYKSDPIVLTYLDYVDLTIPISKIEDIPEYFNELGPTKKLYDLALFDKKLCRKIFKISDWKKLYNPPKEVEQYIYFIQNNGIIFDDYILILDDIKEFFDEFGPKENLYDKALFDVNIFTYLFCDNWKEHYKTTKEIEQYIDFIRSYGYILRNYINSKEEISKFFDESGAKEELYETLLTDKKNFGQVFSSDLWKLNYNPSEEIKQYIQFTLANDFVFSKYITTKEEISKYFDSFGPKSELYDIALTYEKGFSILFGYPATKDWKEVYKPTPEVRQYIDFVCKYGFIFSGYIINKNDVLKYFTATGVSDTFKNLLKKNPERTKTLLTNLSHHDRVLKNITKDFVNIFEYYLIDTYFKDVPKEKQKEQYDYLLNNIGPMLLFNFNIEKIGKLVNIDIEELEKIFGILNSAKYKIVPSNIAYDNIVVSLINFEFRKKYPELVNIFSNVNSLLVNMSDEEFENYVYKSVIGPTSEKLNKLCFEIITYLKLDENGVEDLKNALIECKVSNEDELRKYCRKYLKKKEKEYLENRKEHILNEIGIPLVFDRKDGINKITIYIQNNISYKNFDKFRYQLISGIDYENILRKTYINKLSMTKSEYDEILSMTESEFNSIVSSIKTNTKPDSDTKKKYIYFKRFTRQYASYMLDNEDTYFLQEQLGVKKENKIVLQDLDVIRILSELDVEGFLNTIGNNEQLLKNLSRHFEWFFIGRLSENFRFFFENNKVKLPGGINNIGQFVTRYYSILLQKQRLLNSQGTKVDNLGDIKLFFTEIIEYISRSNSEIFEIMRLLGSEEYNDFVTNAPRNSAQYSRSDREKTLVEVLDFLYLLDKVTIPSKDIIISNKADSKQINFIVGNRTNASNICHGERTGACMRIGGIGEGLFLKCLTDKNWFHIRLEDPVTHEYISRVSGFRNGNTVYLNQLRDSAKIDKYSNRDLQEFIKIYAKSLIEETKSSEYPIENVFINTNYAMEGYKDEEYKKGSYTLGYDIQKEYNLNDVLQYKLYPKNDIWIDVRTEAYLLATTEEGAKTVKGYVPLKNGPENTEIYDAVRDKIYGLGYRDSDIPKHQFVQINTVILKEKINRVHGMKEKLLGKDYRYYITDVITYEEEIIDGYASSDWYVYIDGSYEIHFDFIQEINKDNNLIPYNSREKAREEMEKYKEVLINKYDLNNKKRINNLG